MKRLFVFCVSLILSGAAQAFAAPSDQTASARPPPADDAQCSVCDGMRLLGEGDYERAMDVFQRLAAKGDPAAVNDIGLMYEQGLGVPVDYDRARRYYTVAMKAGGAGGMISLGSMYEQGHGVAVDYAQARRYYTMAEDAGSALGASMLGLMYQHGTGVPVDYGQAMRLYHEAIVGGPDSLAMEQIGFMLQHGLGQPPNPREAWCWYQWADSNGQQPKAEMHIAELAVAGQEPVTDCSVLNQWPVKPRTQTAARGASASSSR